MARSLLIALLSVVAVAGPASAQWPDLPPAPQPLSTAEAVVDATVDPFLCLFMPCHTTQQGPCSGDLLEVKRSSTFPGFFVTVDPEHCIRDAIDKALPPTDWISWPTFGDDAASDPEPAPEPSAPAAE